MTQRIIILFQFFITIYACIGCKRPPTLESTKTDGDQDLKWSKVEIAYATDRNIIYKNDYMGNGPLPSFGADRSDSSIVRYGRCLITIPKTHEIGEMEVPSNFNLEFTNDPSKHIVINHISVENKNVFFNRLSKQINRSKTKSALVFIHGYNVSFEDAAKRTAQIHYDLKFNGVSIFYSWPSKNEVLKYTTDEANIEWTQAHLERFLKDFFANTQTENVYIIAHSMGNRAMSKAIGLVANSIPSVKEKIKEVILAAPDVDAETFKETIAPALEQACKRVTVYGSASDMAILLSKQFHSYKRLGDTFEGASTISGCDLIDATGVDTSFLGHSYIATTRTILADIAQMINNGIEAAKRFGLEQVNAKPVPYWKFAK